MTESHETGHKRDTRSHLCQCVIYTWSNDTSTTRNKQENIACDQSKAWWHLSKFTNDFVMPISTAGRVLTVLEAGCFPLPGLSE